MKAKAILFGLALVALSGCNEETTSPVDPGTDPEFLPLEASEVVLDRMVPRPGQLRRFYREANRTELPGGIAHYEFLVPFGDGAFDVVRIHRVVQERRPRRPVRTESSVFMAHGASQTFDGIFLEAGAQSPDARTSAAIYLASNGIDVWGMDFGWTLVPAATTDFTFMADWGLGRDVDHTLAAMSVARVIRGLTGQGFGPMHLLGYSYGAGVTYAAAGRETRERRNRRDIRGIIPVDQAVKFAEPAAVQWACQAAEARAGMIASGMYQDPGGLGSAGIGKLALSDPQGASQLAPGLTNYQAAVFIGARTFQIGAFPSPSWHFVGGSTESTGAPELLYTDPDRWIRLLASLPPYMPVRARLDGSELTCGETENPLDDHLSDISVPILYVGAAGAIGTMGHYTSDLTASSDVTNHTISLTPMNTVEDYGHADLFLGDDASMLVWDGIRRWIFDHSGRSERDSKEG